jgi:hypothetical protein
MVACAQRNLRRFDGASDANLKDGDGGAMASEPPAQSRPSLRIRATRSHYSPCHIRDYSEIDFGFVTSVTEIALGLR